MLPALLQNDASGLKRFPPAFRRPSKKKVACGLSTHRSVRSLESSSPSFPSVKIVHFRTSERYRTLRAASFDALEIPARPTEGE